MTTDDPTTIAALEPYDSSMLAREIARRDGERQTHIRRSMDRLVRHNRVRNELSSARDALDRANAELTRRKTVLTSMQSQGLLSNANDLRIREIDVEQAERTVSAAQSVLTQAEEDLKNFEAAQ